MADEKETKPKAPRKKAAAKTPAAPKRAAKKTTVKKTTAKKPAASKSTAKKKPAAAKAAPSTQKAKKAAESATIQDKSDHQPEGNTMNKAEKDGSTGRAEERETFVKDPHLEPTGTLADKIWRLIAMTAFAMIAYFAVLGVIVLAAVQFVVVLLDEKPSSEVSGYMSRLNGFLQEIIAFLSFSSNEMPFPFKTFPDGNDKNA